MFSKKFFNSFSTLLVALSSAVPPLEAQTSSLTDEITVVDGSMIDFTRGMDPYSYSNLVVEIHGNDATTEEKRNELLSQLDDESRKIFILATAALKSEKLPIVGYGSLLNPESARFTLSSDAIEKSIGVCVHGYRRIFNIFWPFSNRRMRPSDPENAVATLNVMQTDNPNEHFNGVMYWIGVEDFIALRRREAIYDLVPVATTSYGDKNGSPFIAYAWSVIDPQYLRDDITPIPAYYPIMWEAVNSEGARTKLGNNVAEEYLDSTFLANGDSVRQANEELSQVEPIY